ncbi:AAA family ATPase [Acutalibacter sp. 1XD8-36]|uniref:AAA family ATPase n=1 Tax=Acutalibacter sp. 1XD8-36 TaxID=2320852 RepID=UPI00261DA364|nr:AAA family ATPase [Acutalibacter sp. 1XD8-36]
MEHRTKLTEILPYIDPATLSYQEWVNVGMGLKEAGYTAQDWERWSARDSKRYHPGECERKWETFGGAANPVTGGTIVQMALDRGWRPPAREGRELAWDDIISADDDLVVVNQDWVEAREVEEPQVWDAVKELISYLEVLFDADDCVGYVTKSYEKDGKHIPSKGCYDRTAGKLIQELSRCNGDIGRVLGDYSPEAGAWIRFNPLDGKGVKNENVTDFRYALVESDSIPVEKQNAIIRELELPVAALVHSGGKSIHAIVRVEAGSYEEYRTRVDYLYEVCKKNGLEPDRQNRNPSRLSRMPGVKRRENKQFLVATNIGKASWNEWKEWVESVNDDLPDLEEELNDNLPELAPELIGGILRQGHKMLLAGPSKAGKSYALIELAVCIAEGRPWLGFSCARGKVMYVNLELDRASCLHRFWDVRKAMKMPFSQSVDIWNLRGHSIPMDKLAPKLIRRAMRKNYIAIIIDPIYKVITGDENSADQMANFCNQFDKVCTELGTAVIYCHHHSKGAQGGKRSMDRASGSGVFARDPDALLDLIELDLTEELLKQEENKAVCAVCMDWLSRYGFDDEASQDDACSESVMLEICRKNLQANSQAHLMEDIAAARKAVQSRTAWRIEGTLREFPKFPPVNLWFDYPIHRQDMVGVLKDIAPEAEVQGHKRWQKKGGSKREAPKEQIDQLGSAFEWCDESGSGEVSIAKLMEHTNKSRGTIKGWVDKHPDFERENGMVRRVSKVSEVSN